MFVKVLYKFQHTNAFEVSLPSQQPLLPYLLHSGDIKSQRTPLPSVPCSAGTSALGLLRWGPQLAQFLCPVLLMAKEKAPVSFKGGKKKDSTFDLHVFPSDHLFCACSLFGTHFSR